jgi:[ribosomal protein S18]-alanine N-acetyltransferase
MIFKFRPIVAVDAQAIVTWQYQPPYDFYNTDSSTIATEMNALLNPGNAYYAVTNEKELIAFYCFGQDAQVPGGDYRLDALDIGMGLRPDLTSRGLGLPLVMAGLAFAESVYSPSAFRVTVATFNQRALRVWDKAGFQPVQIFKSHLGDSEFMIRMRRI